MKRLILAVALAAGCTLASSAPALAAARTYDCSKPGNANKAVCKSAAASPAKPLAKETTVATTTRHYDCSKAGNANKQECKVSTASNVTATKPVAAPKPAPAAAPKATPAAPVRPATTSTSTENNNPAGAIAQCKDGTYSHAKQRTGACSRHGGVAKWM